MIGERHILGFFGTIGWPEILLLGILALLIFGNRLPDVGRSLGRGIIEFKKGIREIKDDLDQAESDEKPPPKNS